MWEWFRGIGEGFACSWWLRIVGWRMWWIVGGVAVTRVVTFGMVGLLFIIKCIYLILILLTYLILLIINLSNTAYY